MTVVRDMSSFVRAFTYVRQSLTTASRATLTKREYNGLDWEDGAPVREGRRWLLRAHDEQFKHMLVSYPPSHLGLYSAGHGW